MPPFVTAAPDGVAGSNTRAWVATTTPASDGLAGIAIGTEALPPAWATNRCAPATGAIHNEQPGRPTAASGIGSGVVFHCVKSKPNTSNAAPGCAGNECSCSCSVLPSAGTEPGAGASSGTPLLPAHPVPCRVHVGVRGGNSSQVSEKVVSSNTEQSL